MNILLKHKLKFIILILLVVLFFTLKSGLFYKTDFVVLNQMTRIDTIENRIDEIILVKNPPKTTTELKKMILNFNSKRQHEFKNIHQTFIKEHDYIFLPALFLSENYSYEDKNINSEKLDIGDFLAMREKYLNWNKREIDTLRCFIGKHDYYKE